MRWSGFMVAHRFEQFELASSRFISVGTMLYG